MIKKFQRNRIVFLYLSYCHSCYCILSLFNARATEGKEKQEDKVEQSKDAFQNAVDMLYGTEENAKKNIIIQQECMKKRQITYI